MASQRQDFLRKLGKGWSPIHMNLNRPKMAFHKPKTQEDTKIIESDSDESVNKADLHKDKPNSK